MADLLNLIVGIGLVIGLIASTIYFNKKIGKVFFLFLGLGFFVYVMSVDAGIGIGIALVILLTYFELHRKD